MPTMLEPRNGSGSCATTGCWADLHRQCPSELRVDGGDSCASACAAFGKPEYCCTGEFRDSSKCKPSNYSKFFKSACPKAYSYQFDDATSTFTCLGPAIYTITFCPSSSPSLTNSFPNSTGSSSGSGSDSSSADLAAVASTTSWLANLTAGASTESQALTGSNSALFVAVCFILSLL